MLINLDESCDHLAATTATAAVPDGYEHCTRPIRSYPRYATYTGCLLLSSPNHDTQ